MRPWEILTAVSPGAVVLAALLAVGAGRRRDQRIAERAAHRLGVDTGIREYNRGAPCPPLPGEIPTLNVHLPRERRADAADYIICAHFDAGCWDGWWEAARDDLGAELDAMVREATA